MKKTHILSFLVTGAIALLMVSCDSRPKATPLTGSLETFRAKDDAGNWSLSGVRITGTDSVVVGPDNYQRITADEHLIVCVKTSGGISRFWVYETDGRLIGSFDTFNHLMRREDAHDAKDGYYLGTDYNRKCYYFPRTKTAINTRQTYEGTHHLLLQDGEEWKLFTYDGEQLADLSQDATLIHNLTAAGKEEFFLATEEKEKVIVADIADKKTVSTYPRSAWNRFVAEQKDIRRLPRLTVIRTKAADMGTGCFIHRPATRP